MTRPKILLVDDREENIIALAALLRDNDAEILRARSGDHALDLLLLHEVALALVDVQMPEMDGFELAEIMRSSARTREIPIIFVTAGLHDQARIFKGYESGAVDFLIKPLDPPILGSKVQVFLQLHRQRQQLAERVVELEAALTDRRRAQETSQRYGELLHLSQDAILVWRFDGGIELWNHGAEELYGYRAEEALGRDPHELLGTGADCGLERGLREQVRWFGELRHRRKDGTEVVVSAKLQRMRGDDGVTRVLEINRDISERKRAEEALREADRRKTEFLAVLSHELRNPLTPIKNSLFILDRSTPGGVQAMRAKAVIDRQVDQLARLVDDLLDVTRVTRNKIQLQRRQLDLRDLVRRTLEDHRSLFERSQVKLELAPSPEAVIVDGDWNRLIQVVGNLLQNATKFTGAGGTTKVSVGSDGQGHAVIRVADTGVGMTSEVLSHLFEPFVQADRTLDRSNGGLGLGLALVKGLVSLHGGEIEAHSEGLGSGSEFIVRLPLGAEETAERPPSAAVERQGKHRRILIIEDNIDAAESLREVLALGEHDVEVAFTGPEGLKAARSFHPDVILCDIGLPGMDGYEVARTLRDDPTIKRPYIVALTGYALPDDLERAAAAGFDRHLAKPPDLDKIEELLENAPS